jgi:hypothetical protein
MIYTVGTDKLGVKYTELLQVLETRSEIRRATTAGVGNSEWNTQSYYCRCWKLWVKYSELLLQVLETQSEILRATTASVGNSGVKYSELLLQVLGSERGSSAVSRLYSRPDCQQSVKSIRDVKEQQTRKTYADIVTRAVLHCLAPRDTQTTK